MKLNTYYNYDIKTDYLITLAKWFKNKTPNKKNLLEFNKFFIYIKNKEIKIKVLKLYRDGYYEINNKPKEVIIKSINEFFDEKNYFGFTNYYIKLEVNNYDKNFIVYKIRKE